MVILNAAALDQFARQHRDAALSLAHWMQIAAGAAWHSLADIRQTFPSADGVIVRRPGVVVVATVFNIRGNHYRLITLINFERAVIRVAAVLTHAEYDKDKWKDRL